MVFTKDAERAAELARAHGVPTGLHLNLTEEYDAADRSASHVRDQHRIVAFLSSSRYAVSLYHPGLRREFRDVVRAQWDEYVRLYGAEPARVDGHRHGHLCANLLVEPMIPRGVQVRRNFSFLPGQKSWFNRLYRRWVDARLKSRYRVTDYFFPLRTCFDPAGASWVEQLASTSSVELMAHPRWEQDFNHLRSERHRALLEAGRNVRCEASEQDCRDEAMPRLSH